MRRFLITSDKFKGQAELVYNSNDQLIWLDMRNADMSEEITVAFKRAAPANLNNLQSAFTTGTTVIESDFEVSLDDFKREYPYSRNYHLLDKRWSKMNKSNQLKSYFAAIEYRKFCERTGLKPPFIRIADTWLAREEYLNDWKNM